MRRLRLHAGAACEVVVDQANKAIALNAGDAAARGFRESTSMQTLRFHAGRIIAFGQAFAASSTPRGGASSTRGCDPAAACRRAYFAINSRLPAFQNGLFGRGMIALSERDRRAIPTPSRCYG